MVLNSSYGILFLILLNVFKNCDTLTVSLVNGTYNHEGRVEVYSNGQWHTVCGHNWGFKTADIICKEIGYQFALHPSSSGIFGRGSGSMVSVPVVCNGSERQLQDCTFMYDEVCSHRNDIGVICSSEPLQEGSVRIDGTLGKKNYPCGEVQVYLDGKWGGICDKRDTWNDVAAEIACQQMGFSGHVYTSYNYLYKTKQVIGSLYCTGKESRLLDCHYDRKTSGCSRITSSPSRVGVTVCCYYNTFTLWFTVKLLALLLLSVGIPIWICVKSGWLKAILEYMEQENSKQSRGLIYQNPTRPMALYEEVQYTSTVTKRRFLNQFSN